MTDLLRANSLFVLLVFLPWDVSAQESNNREAAPTTKNLANGEPVPNSSIIGRNEQADSKEASLLSERNAKSVEVDQLQKNQLSDVDSFEIFAASGSLGVVRPGQKLLATARFKNTTNFDLVVANYTSSCGCTSVILKEKRVKPNEEIEFRIGIDPGKTEGNRAAEIGLLLESSESSKSRLLARYTMNYRVRQECSLLRVPDEIKLVGGIGEEFEVVNYGSENWEGIEIVCDARELSFDVRLSDRTIDGEKRQVGIVVPRLKDGSQTKDVYTRTELNAVGCFDEFRAGALRVIGTKDVTLFSPGRIQVTPESMYYSGDDDLRFFVIAHDLDIDLKKSNFKLSLRVPGQSYDLEGRFRVISSRWIEVRIPNVEIAKIGKREGRVEIVAIDSVHRIFASVGVNLDQ